MTPEEFVDLHRRQMAPFRAFADGVRDRMTILQLLADRSSATVEQLKVSSNVEPILIDAPKAAQLLGISIDALQKRVARNQLPVGCVRRTGRRVQFVRAKLIEGRGGAR